MSVRRGLVAVAAACGLSVAAAPAAQGHVLSNSRAKATARSAAARLARRRPGDAARPRYSAPVCLRRSRHRFVCTTTIRGTSACDRTEAACDGPTPWELSYAITVRFASAGSMRLRVSTREV